MQVNSIVSLFRLLACIETCAFHGGVSNSPAQSTEALHRSIVKCLE